MEAPVSLDTQVFFRPSKASCMTEPRIELQPSLPQRRPLPLVPPVTVVISDDEDADVDDAHDVHVSEAHFDEPLPSVKTLVTSISSSQQAPTSFTDAGEEPPEIMGGTGSDYSRGCSFDDHGHSTTPGMPLPATVVGGSATRSSVDGEILSVTALHATDMPRQRQDENAPGDPTSDTDVGADFEAHANSDMDLRGHRGSTYSCEGAMLTHGASLHDHGGVGRGDPPQSADAPYVMDGMRHLRTGQDRPDAGGGQHSQALNSAAVDNVTLSSLTEMGGASQPEDRRLVADNSRASQAGQTTSREKIPLLGPRTQRKRRVKRISVAELGSDEAETDGSDHEFSPKRKAQNTTGPTSQRKHARANRKAQQKPRAPASRKKANRCGDRSPMSSTRHTENVTLASYQEWPLSDASLKCIREDGMAVFQLEFTWGTPCKVHACQHATITTAPRSPPSQDENLCTNDETRSSDEAVAEGGKEPISDDEEGDGIFTVERMLARWKTGSYFLRWSDGSYGWEPKKNILDKRMLHEFEAAYRGFDEGVDVLDSRMKAGKRQYLLRWHGRPPAEDSWVAESLMSTKGIERFETS